MSVPVQRVKLSVVKRGGLVPFSFGATALGWHNIQPFTICPKEYQFVRVRGIRQRAPFVSEPLSVGLLLHVARAQWLSDGRKEDLWRTAMLEYAKQYPLEEGKPLHPAALKMAVQCFEAYESYWSVRPTTKVLAVEHEIKPRALVPDAPQWAWRGARLDSIELHRGKAWLGELKSTSSGAGRVHDIYLLNGQTMLQAALYGPEEEKRFGPLGGILLDVIVKPSGRKPAKAGPRIPLLIEDMQHALTWFRKDFTTWVMQASMIQWNDHVERRPVCMRSHGPCEFRSMCLKGRKGSNMFVFADGSPVSAWQPSEGKEVPPWS